MPVHGPPLDCVNVPPCNARVIASDSPNFTVQFLEQNQLVCQSCRRPMSAIDAVDGSEVCPTEVRRGEAPFPEFGPSELRPAEGDATLASCGCKAASAECRLLAQRRPCRRRNECLLFGVKQTCPHPSSYVRV